ncbi:hypothetical protein E2C01_003530 [Portunus trituberculatus]|uniref:Uncharacterized protein n=1 Tax=Portunus trituberculatus TaxID=210409 RepID=A0A5B7CMN4_PORTR|nr:hypothetical protein [Portunus trituberculatus]
MLKDIMVVRIGEASFKVTEIGVTLQATHARHHHQARINRTHLLLDRVYAAFKGQIEKLTDSIIVQISS